MSTVKIAYFSDVLCIWAHVAQIRVDELNKQFGEKIEISHHFIPLFSDTKTRIGVGWVNKGKYEGFSQHVQEVCAKFPHEFVHENVWLKCRPHTSNQAHLFIKAIQLSQVDNHTIERIIWDIRCAFFHEAKDIADMSVLFNLLEAYDDIESLEVMSYINNGQAMAALFNDIALRDEYHVSGSPTFILNQGRQKLYGNVGYKIIEANVLEALELPNKHYSESWC